MAKKAAAKETNRVYKITRLVDVAGITSELQVRIALKTEDGTWAITTKLTTKQVDPGNEKLTAAVLTQLAAMLEAAVETANEKRKEVLRALEEGNGQQQSISFN